MTTIFVVKHRHTISDPILCMTLVESSPNNKVKFYIMDDRIHKAADDTIGVDVANITSLLVQDRLSKASILTSKTK